MAKTKSNNNSFDPKAVDILALLLAGGFLQTTLTTFHHAAFNRYVGPPSWPVLGLALLLTFYSVQKQNRISTINVIVLTVLAVSSLFWLSGLRTNFYF